MVKRFIGTAEAVLWICLLLILAVLAFGCAQSPLAPSPVSSTEAANANLIVETPVNARECAEARIDFHDTMLGTAVVTNLSKCEHSYTLVVWDYRSEFDQVPLAAHSMTIAPGGSALLSLAFTEQCGKTYQRDVFMDLPLAQGQLPSLLDAMQRTYWVTGSLVASTAQCPSGVQPPRTLPPPPVSKTTCERAAFASVGTMTVTGGIASIPLRLNAGYDRVVVYLLAYVSATPFIPSGERWIPTFPQTLSSQQSFIVRAGVSQTFSLPVPLNARAWQVDAGCVPGPAVLRSRGDYPAWAFLEAALGSPEWR